MSIGLTAHGATYRAPRFHSPPGTLPPRAPAGASRPGDKAPSRRYVRLHGPEGDLRIRARIALEFRPAGERK